MFDILKIFFSNRFISNFGFECRYWKIISCGFDPYEAAHNEFDIKFYLFAILFLLFDIETIYFFPLIFHNFVLIDFSFDIVIDFVLELLLCYLYAYKTDVFWI